MPFFLVHPFTRIPEYNAEEHSREAIEKIRKKHALNFMNKNNSYESNGVVVSKSPDEMSTTLKALRELIHEQKKLLNKHEKEQEQLEIGDEWEKIENRVDFLWIFFFEALNVFNLVLLMIIVSVPSPTIDDWLYGKTPIELLTS